MAELKTTYQDDVLDTSKNTKRKYNMITNSDGTVSFEDVTEYSQVGDTFGASQVNEIDTNINALNNITCDPWDSSKTYLIGEYCVYNGKLYRCLRDNTGQTPAEGTYWTSVKVADEVNTLNQSLATKVNTSALGTAAYKAYTTSVTSGSTNLVTSGAVYTKFNTIAPTTREYAIKFGNAITNLLIGCSSGTDRAHFVIPTYTGYSKASITYTSGTVSLVNLANGTKTTGVSISSISDISISPSGILRMRPVFNITSLTTFRPYAIYDGTIILTITLSN